MLNATSFAAGFAQSSQFRQQVVQLADSSAHLLDMPVNELVNVPAIGGWSGPHPKQGFDLLVRHVQAPAIQDKGQLSGMRFVVHPVIASRSLRLR